MNWSRAFLAGLAATVVMTIVMVAMGMNIMKSMGAMMVGQNASPGLQYAVGGTIHLMIGLIYGFIFAWLFGRVTEWNRFIKGAVYGLAIAAIAFAAMPLMSSVVGGGKSASNPCHTAKGGAMNPCHGKEAMNPCHPKEKQAAMNPCHGKEAMNPCHPKEKQAAMNPCHGKEAMNPCHPKEKQAAMNPCHGKEAMNPCHPKEKQAAMNPCHPQQPAANPCHSGGGGNPCNPCGGGGAMSSVLSVINHLIYALTLAFVYKAR
jgi:hypothetical protein